MNAGNTFKAVESVAIQMKLLYIFQLVLAWRGNTNDVGWCMFVDML